MGGGLGPGGCRQRGHASADASGPPGRRADVARRPATASRWPGQACLPAPAWAGSRRADRADRAYPGQPEHVGDAAHRVRGLRRDEHDPVRRRAQHGRRPAEARELRPTVGPNAVSTSVASLRACPRSVSITTATLPPGPSSSATRSPPQPAAASAGAVGAALAEHDPEVQLAEGVLQRDRPAVAEPGGEVGREGHRDRAPRGPRACPGWRTCSVVSGGLANRAFTAGEPAVGDRRRARAGGRSCTGTAAGP